MDCFLYDRDLMKELLHNVSKWADARFLKGSNHFKRLCIKELNLFIVMVSWGLTQLAITCLKSVIGALEQGVKYFQS